MDLLVHPQELHIVCHGCVVDVKPVCSGLLLLDNLVVYRNVIGNSDRVIVNVKS